MVSSGDPGVFAMATAVLEEAKQWPGVKVRVIPAMTAAAAVPLGNVEGSGQNEVFIP